MSGDQCRGFGLCVSASSETPDAAICSASSAAVPPMLSRVRRANLSSR